MKKLFYILTLAIILASVSLSAKAQTPSPAYKALVRELLDLSNMRQSTEETVTAGFNNMGLKFNVPTSQVVNDLLDSIWDKYIDECVALYAKYYTLEEVRQLSEFYKTPLGQKLTKYHPVITRESMAIMQKFQPDLTAILTKYIKQ